MTAIDVGTSRPADGRILGSCELNGFRNAIQSKKKAAYTCASNESNLAGRIWDRLDENSHMGAMACVMFQVSQPSTKSNMVDGSSFDGFTNTSLTRHSISFGPIGYLISAGMSA